MEVRRFRFAIPALALAVIACDDPVHPPPPLPQSLTIEPAQVYAGGELKIYGAGLSRFAFDTVRADTTSLITVRSVGDTMVVSIPATARGVYPLRIGGYAEPIGHVTIAGFRALQDHPDFDCNLEIWPEGGPVSILAGRQFGIVQYSPGSNTTRELIPGSYLNAFQFMIGLSYDPGVFLVRPGTGSYEAWRLPTPEREAVVPYTGDAALYQLSDSIFVRTRSHFLASMKQVDADSMMTIFDTGTGGTPQYNDPHGIAFSPNRDLALVMHNYAPAQPVFDAYSGAIRYHLVNLQGAFYAQFSPSGDTIYVVGEADDGMHKVALYDAATGTELLSRNFPNAIFHGLRLDAENQRLFVAAGANAVDVHVLDARTLNDLANMRTPPVGTLGCTKLAFDHTGVYLVEEDVTLAFDYLFD